MSWHLVLWPWLLHAALGGSLILLVGCLAVRFCRQPVRRLRLIELALLGCLLAPLLGRLPNVPHWSAGVIDDPARVDTLSDATPTRGTVTDDGKTPHPFPSSPPPNAMPFLAASPAEAALSPVDTQAEASSPGSERKPIVLPPLSLLVALAYCAGATFLLLRWLIGAMQLRRLHRSGLPAPVEVSALFADLAGSAGRRVRLLVSDRVQVPLTFGLRRPVILLPVGQAFQPDARSDARLRYGLAHEWSHIERGDLLRWHLATLVQFLFFWQPLFWWLRRQLRLSQDYLADALAARQANEAEDYAAYLVAVAKRSLGVPLAGALGIGDRRSNLYRRILMLLNTREPLQRRCLGAWNLTAIAAAVALIGAISVVRLDAGDTPKDDKSPPEKIKKDAGKGETLHYGGTVKDKDTGKPIAGATVTVRRSLYGDPEVKPEKWLVEETKHKTNVDGKYRFTIPPEQSGQRYLYIELDVEAPNYAPQKGFGYALSMIRKNEKIGGRPFFENVELRPGKEISGVIELPDGKPAVGIKVQSYSVTSKRQQFSFEYGSFANTKTDANGRFALTVVTPGDAVFWILPKKYSPSTHPVKAGKRGDLGRFALQEGIVLRGKAVDAQGKPMAGVYVHAENDGRNPALDQLRVADSIGRTALTNAQGEFEMAPLPPGKYRVQPKEQGYDATDEGRQRKRRPLSAVFLPQKVTLSDKEKPEKIEVRAVPHVVIEAQYYDSKGKPCRGHEPHMFGQIDGGFWFEMAKVDANGKVTLLAPHGLQNARLNMMTNEHGSLRHRMSKKEPFLRGRELNLGTLDRDVKGIEIVRYVAPILIIKVVDKDGKKPKDAAVSAIYPPQQGLREGRFILKKGLQSDVTFEEQEDGRFRSSQLLPDLEVTITGHGEGYQSKNRKVTLAEGTTKEIEIVLEKK